MSRVPLRRRSRLVATLAAGVLTAGLGALLTGPPSPAAGDQAAATAPGAEAWAARVELGGTRILEVGHAAVDPAAGSTAVPLRIAGSGLPAAVADPAQPTDRRFAIDWTDQTGSLTVAGGYAEATSEPQRWAAHAGVGKATGTGIALASKVLTWDQQTQLLGALQQADDRIAPVVNSAFAGLAPVLALAGLPAPHFTPLSPTGLVDAGAGRLLGATAEAATGTGFSTARADVATGELELLGGFVTVAGASSEATVERGADARVSATSTLSGVTIAGIPVVVDDQGIRVADGGPLGTLLAPVLHTVLGQLDAAGITIASGPRTDAGCCTASTVGLTVAMRGPSPLLISVAGATATAPEPLTAPPAASAAAPPPETAREGGEPPAAVAAPAPATATRPVAGGSPSPLPAAGTGGGRLGRIADLGPDVAHALEVVYLLLLGVGGAAAVHIATSGPLRPARPERSQP